MSDPVYPEDALSQDDPNPEGEDVDPDPEGDLEDPDPPTGPADDEDDDELL
ncbi:hypothetical protein [Microbacterium tumbae]